MTKGTDCVKLRGFSRRERIIAGGNRYGKCRSTSRNTATPTTNGKSAIGRRTTGGRTNNPRNETIASPTYVNKRTLQQRIRKEARTPRIHYTNDNRGRGNEAAGLSTTKHSLTGVLCKLTHGGSGTVNSTHTREGVSTPFFFYRR